MPSPKPSPSRRRPPWWPPACSGWLPAGGAGARRRCGAWRGGDDKDRGARQPPFGGCHAGEGRDSWIAGQARIGGLVGVPLPRERARRFWLRSLLPRVTPFGGKILDSGGFAAF